MAPNAEFFLDRIEGETAVLISGKTVLNVPLNLLPPGVREGDHLTMTLSVNASRRQKVKGEVEDLQRRLSAGEEGNG